MDKVAGIAYTVTSQLFGPDSGIPLWAWFAVLAMIIGGLLLSPDQDS
jgi:hypothetical protein